MPSRLGWVDGRLSDGRADVLIESCFVGRNENGLRSVWCCGEAELVEAA